MDDGEMARSFFSSQRRRPLCVIRGSLKSAQHVASISINESFASESRSRLITGRQKRRRNHTATVNCVRGKAGGAVEANAVRAWRRKCEREMHGAGQQLLGVPALLRDF
jgi:hypothetical protein